MNNLIIKRSQIVECQLAGTLSVGKRYFFKDIPNLSRNNIVLYGFEAYTDTQLAVTPSGYTTVGSNTGILVTLRDTNKLEFVYQMPMFTLTRSTSIQTITLLKPRVINLTDCYVTLTNTSGLTADEAVAFNFYCDFV